MYSLRHTFASLGRVSGEEAFNVARAMGHSRSRIVDDVYAALPSLRHGERRGASHGAGARRAAEVRLVSSTEPDERDVKRSLDVSLKNARRGGRKRPS